MIDFHCARQAEVSVAAVGVPLEKASSFGIISAGADGRVREFHEKPRRATPSPRNPAQAYASMGNYLFDPRVLERALEEGIARGEIDFGRDLLPRLCKQARVYAYDFAQNEVPGLLEYEEPAYWRDVGTLAALAAAQQDATGQRPRFNLWNRRWPIRGEYDAALLGKLSSWRPEVAAAQSEPAAPPSVASPWRAPGKELRSDERLPTS
jgi:glucose-1-phosphate adenylyltransferase